MEMNETVALWGAIIVAICLAATVTIILGTAGYILYLVVKDILAKLK
jgi:hypothetical protein